MVSVNPKNSYYNEEVKDMGKSKMTSKAAQRIQSHADKSGRNKGFKSRAQSAAAKNSKK